MAFLLDFLAVGALCVVMFLVYLLLFERGTFYRTSGPVHELAEDEWLRVLSTVLGTPVRTIDTLDVLRDGPDLYAPQLAAIRSARRSVHLEAYIFRSGEVADAILQALCERARAGVKVRMIVDAVGSFRLPGRVLAQLREAGGEAHRYHPLRWQFFRRWNSRTHRNLLITDGETAFIGGAGIADHWSRTAPPSWRDCVARVTGRVVAELQAVFAENWLECAGELLVGTDSFPVRAGDFSPAAPSAPKAIAVGSTPTAGGSTRARMLVQFLLASARDSIDLGTPYFIPDMGIRRELIAARSRGVRIRILSGGPYGDHGIVRRTAKASLKMAVDMANAGTISKEEAIQRVDPASLDQLLHPTIDPNAARDVIAAGLPASPGAATGKIVFDADEAERLGQAGESVILVREETSPEDIHGMHAARGVVTARGGMTSHAAVVARGMGRPCVSGAGELNIGRGQFTARGRTFQAGDIITIDGSKGEIMLGSPAMIEPELTGDFATLMGWADSVRRLKVRANAETPLDARTARQFGAEGIGLCRTEHMFFEEDRIAAVREMILADDEAGRRKALAKILPMQRGDFVSLFEIMSGLPVTIRLLDPPLHEFLPHSETEIRTLAEQAGLNADKLIRRARELQETNPMLGHRGCRLGVSYPEIYEMQVRAVIEAACDVAASGKAAPLVEIMHPLVSKGAEMTFLRELTDRTAKAVLAERGVSIDYLVGTMIELPRAALRADALAMQAEFFSFGTNDLTQTTFGISRDDSARFLGAYIAKGIFEKDPFVTLDQQGVGDLIKIAAERGRSQRPGIKLGICGEHGGDPASIEFCETVGLDYVSCSPFRTPIARLAAAQAALRNKV